MLLKTPISKGIIGALFAFFAIIGLDNTIEGNATINRAGAVLIVLLLGGIAFWLLHDAYSEYRNLQKRAGDR